MKTATIPSLRVDPELRHAAEVLAANTCCGISTTSLQLTQ